MAYVDDALPISIVNISVIEVDKPQAPVDNLDDICPFTVENELPPLEPPPPLAAMSQTSNASEQSDGPVDNNKEIIDILGADPDLHAPHRWIQSLSTLPTLPSDI